ncbi:GIY-YIG nuclease family protein [Candidatus Microgenomates bacterium]|nr:GIY-YIG nuclease family protein [Candidatus Microgenomates bacterium]
MWYVYFLKSQKKKNWIYVGSTNNHERRLAEHNSGLVKSTKPYRPFIIIYKESFSSEGEARKREDYFKYWKGRIEKKKIVQHSGVV